MDFRPSFGDDLRYENAKGEGGKDVLYKQSDLEVFVLSFYFL